MTASSIRTAYLSGQTSYEGALWDLGTIGYSAREAADYLGVVH